MSRPFALSVNPTRRRLLAAAAASPALLLPAGLVRASAMDVTRLHPARFFGGLLLDLASAVLVELAADAIVTEIQQGGAIAATPSPVIATSIPTGEGGRPDTTGHFSHPAYKVSVVRLGVVDYQAHRQRVLAVALRDPAQRARFTALRDYLRDEGIRVKLADAAYSQRLGADLEPDDLLTLDYLEVPDTRLDAHLRGLIEASGAGVFETWYG